MWYTAFSTSCSSKGNSVSRCLSFFSVSVLKQKRYFTLKSEEGSVCMNECIYGRAQLISSFLYSP